ncbi:MFS transporter [Olivibacter ginsenosidimutans]|uniref:MFS transporter n=1 Tax=Olivibacter ginsenosidimutans TaxID=1176537 RepID=A0ABP9BNU7_9SPHI
MKNSKYYPWVVVGLLWVVALLNYMDRQMLATMRPSMEADIKELKLATNFGYLMAIFLWIYGIMSPFAGAIADRLSKKWLIVGSLLVWSAVTFAMGFAQSFTQLLLLRAIMGISEALYIPAGLSLIADFHEGKTRSLAVGIHMTGLYMGQALGGFGATLAASFTWHTAFLSFGLVGMIYALVLVCFLRDAPQLSSYEPLSSTKQASRPTVFRGIGFLLSHVWFWVILFYFAVPSLPGWATKNWLPTLFTENLNIPMAQAGPMATIAIAFSSFVGVVVGGLTSDRWVQRNVRGRIYTSAIGLALTIPSLLLLGFGHTFFHVVSAAVLFGLGFGMFDANNMPILCQFVSSRYRATAYGLMNMVGVFSGAFITDYLGQSTDEGNLGKDFALLAGVVLLALLAQLYFLQPKVNDCKD